MPENTLSSSLIFRALIWLKSCTGMGKGQEEKRPICAELVDWASRDLSSTSRFRKPCVHYIHTSFHSKHGYSLPTCMKMKVLKTTELDLVRSSL